MGEHGQAPAGESLRTEALCDLSYSHGLKAGWNYCASDDLAGFERAQKIGTEALRTLKSPTAQQAPAQPDPAYSAACNLATALFKKHFAHLPDYASGQVVWGLFDSTEGVILQIDNMVAGLVQPPTTSPQADSVQEDAALQLIADLVRHIDRETCTHEETHRGGAIWEICNSCGSMWADDKGGKPEFKWPDCVEKARAFLDAARKQGENHD